MTLCSSGSAEYICGQSVLILTTISEVLRRVFILFSFFVQISSTRNMTTEVSEERQNHSMDYYNEWDPFELHGISKNWIFYLTSIVSPIAMFSGVFTNSLAFVVLVRNRLWLKHEGYVYLAAMFCTNIAVLLFCTSNFWLTITNISKVFYPPNTSNFMCKFWHFLMNIHFASGWLSVALLFTVYLREQLTHRRRRCGCPIFAAKYCTLFASKIVVGVIFGVLFVLGLPYLVLFELYDFECSASSKVAFRVTLLVQLILMWVLPFVFFLPIILLITLCTKREGNAFGFSQIEERSASDEQMRVVAVIVSSMTLFSQFALEFLHLPFVRFFGATPLIGMAYGLSLGLQPILCFIILTKLREGFRSQLRSIRCGRRLFPSLDQEEAMVQLSAIQEEPPSRADT